MVKPRRHKGVRSAIFTSLALAGFSVLSLHDATAATCPPGPSKTPPAGCPAPSDAECAHGGGAYSSTKNPGCAEVWAEHCACVNTAAFNASRQPHTAPANMERVPSPTKTVYSSDPGKNSAHVSNYGLRTDWLQGTQPAVAAKPLATTIANVPAKNVGAPPLVAQMTQQQIGARSQHFYTSKKIGPPKAIPKSKQNIWAAQETYAHAMAAYSACTNKTGDDLIACAKAYHRPLHATPPKINDCEDFVYNRFYDVESFEDHMAACRGDISCKAAIALDRDVGVAGRGLTGSDVDPSKRDFLKKLFEAFDHGQPPNCDKKPVSADDLHLCELAGSIPPIAFVKPGYFGPIAGGGKATSQIDDKGDLRGIFSTAPSVGYYMTKNPYYDSAAMITPLVIESFRSDPAKYASIQRLLAELKKPAYYVGKSFPTKNVPAAGVTAYPDEWSYERAMHNAVKNRPVRVIRDFEKRKNFLKQRSDTFDTLYWALPQNQIHFKIAGAPGDADLKSASAAMTGFGVTRTLVQPAVQAKPTVAGATMTAKATPMASLVPVKPSDLDIRAWGKGGKAPPLDPAYKYPRLQCSAPDKLVAGFTARQDGSYAGAGKGLPMTPINGPAINHAPSLSTQADVTMAACNLVNAVLDEWARADSPKILAPNDTNPAPMATGCFAGDAACDWDPATFVHGVRDMVKNQIDNVQHAQREADYKACKAWLPEISTPANLKKYSDQKNGELLMLGAIKTEVQTLYNEIADVPVLEKGPVTAWSKLVPMKPETGDTFATFGEDRHNAEVWGNDLFGVGYSYDIGWEIPVRWEQVEKDQHYEVCDFGIGAHGGFEAYAFAFGSDKFDILAADIVAGAHDYTNPQANGEAPGADPIVDTYLHDAAFDAHFVVAGDSIVAQDATKVDLTPPNNVKTVPFASGANSWNLFTIPFQISFVTLEMSVGVGYSYAVDMKTAPYHQNSCHEGAKVAGGGYPWPAKKGPASIGLDSSLQPQAELDGIIDAYASIAGLAGVGVDVNLTLLGIGLPATNSIRLDPKSLNINSTLNMDFHTLDGSLSVYAELLFFTLFDIEIMSWDGFHSTVPLFNTSTNVDMPALSLLGKTGLTNPAKSLQGL